MATIRIDQLDCSLAVQGWESPKTDRSVTGGPLAIAGTTYAHGLGTHSVGQLLIRLDGRARRFTAMVGVDDAVGRNGHGAVRFVVRGDGRVLADTGVLRGGEPAHAIACELDGIALLELLADAPDDHTHHGHADWCDARIDYDGTAPVSCRREREPAVIRTPPAGPLPYLTGPAILGHRPGAPVVHRCTATGTAPLRFSATGLPPGIAIDPGTGQLQGSCAEPGRWTVAVTAENAAGSATRDLEVVIGEGICLTPPLGWNSWNCCGPSVDAAVVRQAARALVDTGLAACGWSYVNIDDGWQGVRRADAAIAMALQSNAKFPDMAALVAEIHGLGLRAGIYSVPGVWSPAGLPGGSADHADGGIDHPYVHGGPKPVGAHRFEMADAAQWAAWGIDYVKYDGCPSVDSTRRLRDALDASGRDIVLSLSARMPHGLIDRYRRYANCWRTTGDLIDTWFGLRNKFAEQRHWQDCSRPGAWNDPDMLVLGRVGPGWDAPLQDTRLSPHEQELHVSMWAMLAAPLLLGAHPERLDDFTLSLLRNTEILAIHQDPLGQQARYLGGDDELQWWRRPLADGGEALAAVNLGETTRHARIARHTLGVTGDWTLRDCWVQEDLGLLGEELELDSPAHGCRVLRLVPAAARS